MVQLRKKKENKRSLKETLKLYVDESQDRDAAKVRLKWMDRWAKITNCPMDENGKYDHSKIDFDNEFVRLEWYLCDPRILFKVTNDDTRADGLKLIPEELWETYYKTGPGNSLPYNEVYAGPSKVKHIFKKELNKRKAKKGIVVEDDSIDLDKLREEIDLEQIEKEHNLGLSAEAEAELNESTNDEKD